MEKWENRKNFNFSHFYLVGSGKVEGYKKWVCQKLTHIPLLKNDAQLKKNVTNKQKKNQSPKFIKK